MNMRPVLVAPPPEPPVKAITWLTAGSCRSVNILAELLLHRLERGVLIGLDRSDQPPVVLLGKEALGNDDEEVDVEGERGEENPQRQERASPSPTPRLVR